MSNKLYYLNSSSTNYKKTHQFNMADAFYKENRKARKEVEALEAKIKRLINAPKNSKVIFNSGATEGIATCVHWAKSLFPYGTVMGTTFDHSAIKDNCQLYKLNYEALENENQCINDRATCIFITHVSSKTGEIYDLKSFLDNYNGYQFLYRDHSDFTNMNYNKVLQYPPLIFLDATQSITKLPIDMAGWGLDAVFWSNHKLGGDMGKGVLVINPNKYEFTPLIAGAQNNGLRGGSQSADSILRDQHIYDQHDDINSRKNEWLAARDYLKSRKINVYEPKRDHLYNTLLLDTRSKCPYAVLDMLASKNIYLSPKSACMMEQKLNEIEEAKHKNNNNNNWQNIEGGDNNKELKPFDNAIRISFTSGDELDGHALEQIADMIVESFRSNF